MQNNKFRAFLGLLGFIVLLSAISLAIWKYAGLGSSFSDVVTSLKTKNLIKHTQSNLDIKIGYDGYLGYSILESKQFHRNLEQVELSTTLIDDNANYPQRFSKLLSGELDMAVMPIHDYIEQLEHSQSTQNATPLIIAAISESMGSDAVLANANVFANINDLKAMKHIKAAYTSQFMLGSMAIDANIPSLLNSRTIDANADIEQTYNGLLSGKYDVVGLWEPYITKAKEKGFIVLMGSDELKLGKIIDVVVINRAFLANHTDNVKLFMQTYYESVSNFNTNRTSLIDEIEIKHAGELSRNDIASSLDTIKFYSLAQNSYNLFHIHSMSVEKILDYIDAVAIKLKKMYIIDANPIVDEDSRNIVYTDILRSVYNAYPAGSIKAPAKEDKVYEKISHAKWIKLIKDPKFTRDDLKITFLRDGRLNNEAKNILDNFALHNINNFDYYVAIVGRSGKARGLREEELVKRTEKKARQVYEYLAKYWSIDKNRLHPIGLGSKGIKPIKKGENYYQYLNEHNKVELLFIDY